MKAPKIRLVGAREERVGILALQHRAMSRPMTGAPRSSGIAALLALGFVSAATGCCAFGVERGYQDERSLIDRLAQYPEILERSPTGFRREPADDPTTEAALVTKPTLEIVQETALRRNPDVRAALERWREATERVPQASGYPFPSISYSYRDMEEMHMVAATQPIPFPGKLTAQGRAALALSRAAHEDFEERRNELRAAAASALYGLFFRRRELKVITENLTLLDHFVEISRALYAAGKRSQQDVLKAEVERSNLKAASAGSTRQVEVALAGLNALLDRMPRAQVGEVDEPVLALPDLERGALYRRALERRPMLIAAVERVAGADEALTRARLEYFPDFVIGGGYERNTMNNQDGGVALAGITIPLWYGKIRAGVEEAEARSRRIRNEVESARNRVLNEVESAAALTEAAAAQAKIFESETVPQARQALQVAEADYQAGRIEFLSLIDAERLLLRAELDRYRAVAGFGERNADLHRAVGGVEETQP